MFKKILLIFSFIFLASFNELLGLECIELDVFSTNTRAIALYEKSGFLHEGIKRKARFIDNEWSDRVMMGLLREEWHRD